MSQAEKEQEERSLRGDLALLLLLFLAYYLFCFGEEVMFNTNNNRKIEALV